MGRITGLLVLVVLLVGAGTASAADSRGRLTYEGRERGYYLHVPPTYDGAQPVPLLVALHGFASSGRALATLTGFDTVADRDGFIVVYPDSAGFSWDDGRSPTGWPPDQPHVDDVGFIGALIDDLSAAYTIDPARIYLAGYANGGAMAYRLACETPERFARVAVMGALLWDYHTANCPAESAPVPLLILLGELDATYPPGGRLVPGDETEPDHTILSAGETLDFWCERNGCHPDAVQPIAGTGGAAYDACEGAPVALILLEGVASNWPRVGEQYTLNQTGFDAAETMARFFAGETDWSSLAAHTPVSQDQFEGLPRTAVLYVPPSYDPAQPSPLVLALHGRPSTGTSMAYLLDMNQVADREGFIVAYPEGVNKEWNASRGLASFETSGNYDDVAFLNALVDDLSVDLNIDPSRLYITGFSNGGFMAQRMACDFADRFAGFAVVGATLLPYFLDICDGTPPAPVLFIHGTLDQSVPWEGTMYQDVPVSYPVSDTVLFWALHNGCLPENTESTVLPTTDPDSKTSVYLYTFGGCEQNAGVIFYAIEGGGHNLPGVVGRLDPQIAGEVNMDIHAGQVIWDFFSQYPANGTPSQNK